ncbi:MAG: Hsp20/alpha crystallin family protein [Candidatus Caldarchaeum sp.]|uniref:Hsp20/alpha crystallin family protein n=1 Tax=Caldiarchaeum subterraneum TaxID=311458 RepID=A0A7C5Q3E5_CALS0
MSDWPRWDEFFNRLGREVEERVREALEYSSGFLEPLAGDYRRPRVDITAHEGYVYVVMEMPGCDKQKIEVNADESTITVTAEYMTPPYPEMLRIYPFRYGKGFRRSVQLPRPVDTSKVEARYEAGLLMIKAPFASPKGVRVKIE